MTVILSLVCLGGSWSYENAARTNTQ